MWTRLKKPLVVLVSAGTIGGAGYYIFSRGSGKETVAPAVVTGPKWFNRLKETESSKLSHGMQTAQSWAKAGYQGVAERWVDLICEEEKPTKPTDQEFCNKQE